MFQDKELVVEEHPSPGGDEVWASKMHEICEEYIKSIRDIQKAEAVIKKVADMVGYKGKVDLQSDSDPRFETHLKNLIDSKAVVEQGKEKAEETNQALKIEIEDLKQKLEKTETSLETGKKNAEAEIKQLAIKARFACKFDSGSEEFMKQFHGYLEDLVTSNEKLVQERKKYLEYPQGEFSSYSYLPVRTKPELDKHSSLEIGCIGVNVHGAKDNPCTHTSSITPLPSFQKQGKSTTSSKATKRKTTAKPYGTSRITPRQSPSGPVRRGSLLVNGSEIGHHPRYRLKTFQDGTSGREPFAVVIQADPSTKGCRQVTAEGSSNSSPMYNYHQALLPEPTPLMSLRFPSPSPVMAHYNHYNCY